ncbi:MAG TPA: prolipoprotein diacylglyceryl transferase [Bacteroidales bacterium]|nr:prolipoprotein diacylglyceryl transferase [Bacteroidales bacterium]
MVLNFIQWDVNPVIFELGPFQVRWYGLLFAMAFVLGYIVFKKIFNKEGHTIEMLDQLTVYLAIGTIIGARLGHVLFYDPGYYFAHPLKILAIWEGGLASHGSAIGMLVALYLWARKNKQPYLWLLDRIGIVVALGGMCVRLGNLMNSEIYGIPTSMPWGFIFVRENEILPKHPTQIYEALSYLAIFGFLFYSYTKEWLFNKRGLAFGIFLILLFSARFLIEFIKNPQEDFEKGMPLMMGQILSIPFIVAGIILVFYALRKSAKS